jgi:menaquinone-dependent protoporphyrinogen oxidase
MNANVLVAYATKYGATAEIAQMIGDVLRQSDLQAVVLPVEQVGDVMSYHAVVLGSAVYAGHWLKEAATFLEANEAALAIRPVWLFSSGPTGEGDPVERMHGWRFPEGLQPIADRIEPRDIAFFGGKIAFDNLRLGDKLIVKALRVQAGDFRNWNAIDAWANAIALVLAGQSLPLAQLEQMDE